jgi:hypothetical protein
MSTSLHHTKLVSMAVLSAAEALIPRDFIQRLSLTTQADLVLSSIDGWRTVADACHTHE